MTLLYNFGEAVSQYRELRKAKKLEAKRKRELAKKRKLTGAEEQRELERLSMLAQTREQRLMTLEDTRSMAIERVEREWKVLYVARERELRSRAWKEQEEKEALSLARQDGFKYRFQRNPTLWRWQDSTELYETFDVGCAVKFMHVLSTEDLSQFSFVSDAFRVNLASTIDTDIHDDVVLVCCEDGTVRICRYRQKRNRTIMADTAIVGRVTSDAAVLCACVIPKAFSPVPHAPLILYGAGDGSIRSGWTSWHKVYKTPMFERAKHPGSQETKFAFDTEFHHDDAVYGMTTCKEFLFTWSADGTVKKWCLASGQLLHTFFAHRGAVTACVLSKDGSLMLSAGDSTDPTVRLWSTVETGARHCIATRGLPSVAREMMASIGFEDTVIPGQNQVEEESELTLDVQVDAHHTVSYFVENMCGDCDYNVRLETFADEMAKTEEFQDLFFGVDPEKEPFLRRMIKRKQGLENTEEPSREERWARLEERKDAFNERACQIREEFPIFHSGAIRIFHDHFTGKEKYGTRSRVSHGDWIHHLELRQDNELAVSCSSDKSAKVWKFPSGTLVRRFGCDDWVLSAAFGAVTSHTDEIIDTLVTCCADSSIIIWKLHAGEKLQTLYGHTDVVSGVNLLSNARFTAQQVSNKHVSNFIRTCSEDGTLRTWKLGSGVPFAPPPPTPEDATDTTIVVKWEMPVQNGSPVLEFLVERRENEKGNFHFAGKYVVERSRQPPAFFKMKIGGLRPGSAYEFRVAGVSKHGQGEFSTPSEPRRCLSSTPGRIDAPVINFTTTTEADLLWLAPSSMGSHIQQFVIRYRGGRKVRQFEESPEIKVSWKDAKEKAEQDLAAIQAQREALEKWILENQHLGSKETLKARRKLRSSDEESRKRELLYSFAMSKTGSAMQRPNVEDSEPNLMEMSWKVGGLEPGMAYQFCVVAENKVGRGEFSAPSCSEMTQTCPPDAPSPPKLAGVTISSISISWTPPSANGSTITSFVIRPALEEKMDMLERLIQEEKSASEAGASVLRDNDQVKSKISEIDAHIQTLSANWVIKLKDARTLCSADLIVLQVAMYVLNHAVLVSDLANVKRREKNRNEDGKRETPHEERLASKEIPALPARQEIDSSMRHPEQFIQRIRSFRDTTKCYDRLRTARPCPAPFSAQVHALKDKLPQDSSKLEQPLCRFLLEWVVHVLEYDRIVYEAKVYPSLATASSAWEERKALERELDSSLKTVDGAINSASVDGLEPGQAYKFQVRAVNALGPGPYSVPSDPYFVKRGPPGAPSNVRCFGATLDSLELSWEPPADLNGGTLLGYHVLQRLDESGVFLPSRKVSADVERVTISKLQRQTVYEFVVVAENELGQGPRSEPSNPVSTLHPTPPEALKDPPTVALFGEKTVQIQWKPPAYDGGEPIKAFKVYRKDHPGDGKPEFCGSMQVAQHQDHYEISVSSRLRVGSTYVFMISSENLIGVSPLSAASVPISIPLCD